jgi:hypothetical protein
MFRFGESAQAPFSLLGCGPHGASASSQLCANLAPKNGTKTRARATYRGIEQSLVYQSYQNITLLDATYTP